MKKTEKFIVIRSTETGQYLMKYKNNEGALAYSATWSKELQDAATNSPESVQDQRDKLQKVAEAFGGELLIINATYELETLDGNEPKDLTEEIEEAKRKHFENFLRGLLADNDDEED
ncbi:MAG: hypothetical protein KHX87_03010 [Streptococcus parasanguinis]|uniref:Phage protein n=1 Tax=Streptococcus parasanguinis TaxID=1318 RepID=A0A943HJW1_STRPA|nr:hypothetical protein [Streptococcus parasanguinis]